MRSYRFIKGLTLGFVIGAGSALIYCYWDSPKMYAAPKYQLKGVIDLGVITYSPMVAGPKLREYRCVGGEKDCGPTQDAETQDVINTVPLPGTLWLIGLGFSILLLWRCKR
jgi:hypothetical protein